MQAAKYMELRISADYMNETAFAELTHSLNTAGVSLETDAKSNISTHIAWFAVEGDEQQQRASLTAAALLAHVPEKAVRVTCLQEQDWSTAWQNDWHGLAVGESLWVRPSFCQKPDDNRIDIVLDPGMAFGTGTHATTQLCLQAIERLCKEHMPDAMLDMGAGSGILAIAGLKLGICAALAIDMEEESVAAAKTNAAMNGVTMQVELGSTPPAHCYDLVVANILAGPLVDMAETLSACVSHTLVLSGLLEAQIDMVCAPYLKAGLQIKLIETNAEWAAVTLQKQEN